MADVCKVKRQVDKVLALASALEEWCQRSVCFVLLSCQTCRNGPIPRLPVKCRDLTLFCRWCDLYTTKFFSIGHFHHIS